MYFLTDSYNLLTTLISESCGWKTLRYINHDSAFLGFRRNPGITDVSQETKWAGWRNPQPAYWQRTLENRDGASSGPSVVIYRSISAPPDSAASPGSVLDLKKRVRFEQEVPAEREALRSFGIDIEESLMAEDERSRETMVIVKRGCDVDYEVKAGSPFGTKDFRRDMPGKSWKEICAKCERALCDGKMPELMMSFLDPCQWFTAAAVEEVDIRIETDNYVDIDLYSWDPLFHMSHNCRKSYPGLWERFNCHQPD